MCGICGKWDSQGVSIETLQQMNAEIFHRGPDDEGYFIRGTIGLANRRLSIIDLDTGKQPISNEDETIWIVFNGEIYNYPELREFLVKQGHKLKTKSDTEVIVHLYEEYGLECVKKLRGMFAFGIWDEKRQRLFLARDPLGQKPLYYTAIDGNFAFASEIKALLKGVAITPHLNPISMHHFISLRYIPGQDTLFQGIHKLQAGHILTFEDMEISIQRYWDLYYSPKLIGSVEDIIEQVNQLLLNTVSCHMLSDVPVGVFLSGGIDSSLVAAMMSTLSDGPIEAFSIGVREHDFNELPYARLVAKRYGMIHHEWVVEPDVILHLPEMIWHMEEPVDPFAFGVHSVARLASQHVKVVLGGDGGDEIFAGYDRYLGNLLVELYYFAPPILRQKVIEPFIQRLPDNYGYNNRVQKLRWMVAMSKTSAGERYAQSASFLRFSHAQKEYLYTDELWGELGDLNSLEHLINHYNSENASDLIDKMLYTDVKTRLADHLLMITDRMTMAHSLEGRSPLVDQSLVELAARIPAAMKMQHRRLKYVEREIARGYLPDKLINRRKQGFGFPLAFWFRNELRELSNNTLRNSILASEGLFRTDGLVNLLDDHVSGRVDHNYRIWLLFNLELWFRIFILNESPENISDMFARSMKRGNQVLLDKDSIDTKVTEVI